MQLFSKSAPEGSVQKMGMKQILITLENPSYVTYSTFPSRDKRKNPVFYHGT